MIRLTRPRLDDIDQNIQVITTRIKGRSPADLATNIDLRYVVLHALMVIAEAVNHLPAEIKSAHPQVPWSRVVGIGNRIKHEYHRIDPAIVWNVAANHLPPLHAVIKQLIADDTQPGLPL